LSNTPGNRAFSGDLRTIEEKLLISDLTAMQLSANYGIAFGYYYSTNAGWEASGYIPQSDANFAQRKSFSIKPRTEVSLSTSANFISGNAYYHPFMKDANIAQYLDFQSGASASDNPKQWASWALNLVTPGVYDLKMTTKSSDSGQAQLSLVNMSTNAIVKTFTAVWYPINATMTENSYGTIDLSNVPAGRYMLKLSTPSAWDTYLKVEKVSLSYHKVLQTINLTATNTKIIGDLDYSPASATSGLTVQYASSNSAVATIVNGNIHIVGIGSTNITASQSGNSYYEAAPEVTQNLTINARPTISLAGINNTSSNLTDPNADVTILSSGVLTLDASKSVNSLIMESGSNLKLSNYTLTVSKDLILKSDKTSSANISVTNAMVVNGTVQLYKTFDKTKWYFVSFPCDVAIDNIRQISGIGTLGLLGTNWWIKYYDGESRVTNLGTTSNWKNMLVGGTLAANKGYIIAIDKALDGDYVLSFPLNKSLVQSAESSKTIPVTPWGEGSVAANHVGWNLVGMPYLSKFTGSGVGANYLTFHNGTTYTQSAKALVSNINPFEAFFVQANTIGDNITGTSLTFSINSRQLVHSLVDADISDCVQLNFTSTTGSDKTNLIMDDNQSAEYEVNQDLEKWLTIGTDIPQIYTQLNGVNYAFNALPMNNVVNLPIGFYIKTTGLVTINVNALQIPSLTKLLLTDNKTGSTTDLLTSDYSFNTDAGTNNSRFIITAQRVTTKNAIETKDGKPEILVIDGILMVNNISKDAIVRVYDYTGRMVVNKVANNSSLGIPLKVVGLSIVQIEVGAKNWTKKIVNL
jgi:type VI protein secretion system component Hcp